MSGTICSGLILAGGSSRRMGRDKARLVLQGRNLLQRTIDELLKISDDVIVVGRTVEDSRVRSHPDAMPGLGPAGGLLTGFQHARYGAIVVVACDLPFLQASVLQFLVERLPGWDATVPMVESRPQPLHAVWSRDALPEIEERVLAGERALTRVLEHLRVNWVHEGEFRAIDPSGRSFTNLNTPEDLADVERFYSANPASL